MKEIAPSRASYEAQYYDTGTFQALCFRLSKDRSLVVVAIGLDGLLTADSMASGDSERVRAIMLNLAPGVKVPPPIVSTRPLSDQFVLQQANVTDEKTGENTQFSYYTGRDGSIVKHGAYVLKDQNGVVRISAMFSNGCRNGVELERNENGVLTSINGWSAGKRSGPSLHFYDCGNLEQAVYFSEDVRHGLMARWYENREKRFEGWLIDDRQVGLWNYWNTDGTLDQQEDFGQGRGSGQA